MNYFEGLKDEVAIKIRYKELAKTHHPDRGGCVEIMKAVNAQYEKVLTGAYQAAGKSITEIEELLKNAVEVRNALAAIMGCEGIEVELCFMWIWVTGNTQPVKDILKDAGFFWASTKKAWYWRPEQAKSNNRRKMSMDEIRFRHGTEKLKYNSNFAIA